MKIAFKNSGNFFVWVLLPLTLLLLTVAGVTLIPKEAKSRLGANCNFSPELSPSLFTSCNSLAGAAYTACIQRVKDNFCDSDRTSSSGSGFDESRNPLRCVTQRCQTSACVRGSIDTTSPGCLAMPGCGDWIVQSNLGEQCDISPDGNTGTACTGRGFSCLDCHCITTCGDGIAAGNEECDRSSGGGTTFNPQFSCEAGSSCSNKCECIPPPRCGDGSVDLPSAIRPLGEQCDSGSTTMTSPTATQQCKFLLGVGSACNPATCQCSPPPACNDGTVDPASEFRSAEECDSGATPTTIAAANDFCVRNHGTGSTCASCQCTIPPPVPECGDGTRDAATAGRPAETCDPGRDGVNQAAENTRCEAMRGAGSTCVSCQCSAPPVCGDGTVDRAIGTRPAETCDPGRDAGHAASALAICERLGGAGSTCNSTSCQCNPAPICGDGVRNDAIGSRPREQCDAGTNPAGPAAAAAQAICTAEAGIGSTCNTSTCNCNPAPVCGDGHRDDAIGGRPAEVCDPGTSNPTAAAAADRICQMARGTGSTCSTPSCTCSAPPPPVAECGDGRIDGITPTHPIAEQCDPGRGGINQAAANTLCEGRNGPGSSCVGCQCTTAPTCGDGNTDAPIGSRAGEQCDRGTTPASITAANVICEGINGAGATCTEGTCRCGPAPTCGDGNRDEAVGGRPREQCDPGTSSTSIAAANLFCERERGSGSTCVSCQCTPPPPPPAECGDGVLDAASATRVAEVCDPGRTPGTLAAANASCASIRGIGSSCVGCACTAPPARCGDGTVDFGEECDRTDGSCPTWCADPARYGPTATYDRETCKCVVPLPVCGNSIREIGEECDSSAANCPTSGSTCSPPPVAGSTAPGCQCILPPKIPGPYCGDGKVNRDPETCDSSMGNTDLRNPVFNLLGGCRMDCTYCGDGLRNGDEECDPRGPGSDIPSGNFCDNTCKIVPKTTLEQAPVPPFCGDNQVGNGEACDVVNGSPVGCQPDAECYSCECVPTFLEGSGMKCSFNPAAPSHLNMETYLSATILAFSSLVLLGMRRKNTRKK